MWFSLTQTINTVKLWHSMERLIYYIWLGFQFLDSSASLTRIIIKAVEYKQIMSLICNSSKKL